MLLCASGHAPVLTSATDLDDVAERRQRLVDVGALLESIARRAATVRSLRTCPHAHRLHLLTYLLTADNATVQTSAKVIWQRLHHRRTSTFIYKLYFAKMAARYKKIQKYEIYKKVQVIHRQ